MFKKTRNWVRNNNIDSRTWNILLAIGVVALILPLILDFAIPEKKYNSDTVPVSELVYIIDDADLLTDEEEEQLYNHMVNISKYGGVCFYTTNDYSSSTSSLAKEKFRYLYGTNSATIFVVDMYNRYLYIFSDGAIYRTITSAKAETITDNVYRYASNGDYYTCAKTCFDQITALLEGDKIPQPMKHISNSLLSLATSLVIVFGISSASMRIKRKSERDIIKDNSSSEFRAGPANSIRLIRVRKTSTWKNNNSYSIWIFRNRFLSRFIK